MNKQTILTLITFSMCIFSASVSWSKTISGYVKESGSGELLIGVSIYSESPRVGTVTNEYGFYSLTVDADTTILNFVSVGYVTQKKMVLLGSDVTLNVSLSPDTETLKEAVKTASGFKSESQNVQMSVIDIQVKDIKNIPALFGEKDVFKTIQLMPGVQSGSEGQTGLYVRGGGPDQNLIILDDAVVYNAQHLFGFFSLFNGDALRSVELTKGGFPARYGGRLSSVLDMNMKDGNKERVTGEMGIGLLSSRGVIEGPLPGSKGKGSFLVSGRRTYIDILAQPIILAQSEGDETGGYFFYDLNAKANYEINERNRVYLSGYFGRDKFYAKDRHYNAETNMGWGNATATARWNHLFNNKLFANTSLIFSNYDLLIRVSEKSEDTDFLLRYKSGIRDYSIKHDLQYFANPRHSIRTGFVVTSHQFTPSAFVLKDAEFPEGNQEAKKEINAVEMGLYVEDKIKIGTRLQINPGIRYSGFVVNGKTYHNVEPRYSMAYSFTSTFSAKASFAVMNQYIHLLSNTGVGLPTDLWVPATERVKPQRSFQWAGGIAKDLPGKKLNISLEGYYKTMKNIIGYLPGASFLSVDADPTDGEEVDWQDNVTQGTGTSYGLEFFIQRKSGNFTGWVGYTLSWTELQFDEINFGKPFWARYDRRHDVSLVGIYKFSDHMTLSATWVYGTGNAITLPLAEYTGVGHLFGFGREAFHTFSLSELTDVNNFRMRAYHRMDIGLQLSKVKKRGVRTWEFSLYNLYSRKNPFYYFIDTESGNSNRRTLKQFSLFPILPSVSWSYKFN